MYACLLLAAATVAVLAPGMGTLSGIRHPDEAYYVTVVLEMERTGDWAVPRVDGTPSFYKPPLMYWASLLCRAVFGPSLFALRLPCALFTALAVVATYLLARAWHQRRTSLAAALLLLATLGAHRFGRTLMLESGLMAGAALAVLGAVWARRNAYALVLTGLGAAASTLIKWHGVALVPLAAALMALIAHRHARALWSPGALAGAAVWLLLPLPWFVAAAGVPGFGSGFFSENIERLWGPRESPISLLGVPVYAAPWSLVLVGALLSLRSEELREPSVLVPLGWLVIVGAFWLLPSGAQYLHHAQSGLPAACLLMARQLESERAPLRIARFATAGVSMALGLLAPVILYLLPASMSWPAAAALATLALGGALLLRGRVLESAVTAAVGLAVALGVALPHVDGEFISADAKAKLAGTTPYVYGPYPGYYRIALGQDVRRIWSEGDLHARLDAGEVVILDVDPPGVERGRTFEVVATWRRAATRVGSDQLRTSARRRSLEPLKTDIRAVRVTTVARPFRSP